MKMLYRVYRLLKNTSLILVLMVAALSCDCSGGQNQTAPPAEKTAEETYQERIDASRDFLAKERKSIEAYIKDRKLKLKRSGTGLYYQILADSAGGPAVQSEDVVQYDYEVSLMNGNPLYSSATDGRAELKVDKQDAVIGLHESLKLLGLGDKGLFILPSHLAYGVAGDQNKVPPRIPLVYEIKVVNIIKSKS